nr:hypothetical protein [Bacteroidota bacterium]
MKKLLAFILVLSFGISSCTRNTSMVEFKSSGFLIGIDSKGYINQLLDIENSCNYLAPDTLAPLLSCRVDSEMYYPVGASYEDPILTLQFEEDLQANIRVEEKPTHITFELVGINKLEMVELIAWGPVPTT